MFSYKAVPQIFYFVSKASAPFQLKLNKFSVTDFLGAHLEDLGDLRDFVFTVYFYVVLLYCEAVRSIQISVRKLE